MIYATNLKGHTYLHKEGESNEYRVVLHPSQSALIKELEDNDLAKELQVCSISDTDFDEMFGPMDNVEALSKVPEECWRNPQRAELDAAQYFLSMYRQDPMLVTVYLVNKHPLYTSGFGWFMENTVRVSTVRICTNIFDIKRFTKHLDNVEPLANYFYLNDEEDIEYSLDILEKSAAGVDIKASEFTDDEKTLLSRVGNLLDCWYPLSLDPGSKAMREFLRKDQSWLYRKYLDMGTSGNRCADIITISKDFLRIFQALWFCGLREERFTHLSFLEDPSARASLESYLTSWA